MRRYNQIICSVLLLLLVMVVDHSVAQIKVQVVTQKMSKTVEWTSEMSMIINAENAEIYCTSHPANTIDIDLTIISKHEDKSTAEADLKKMKWLTEVKSNILYIRNYIELARNDSKPESALKVIYNIRVPENCPIDVRNYFGKIEIENLNSILKINSEFSKIDLRDIGGVTTVNTVFGDVTATRILGEVAITSNRSDIIISDFGGKLNLNATLAKINLYELKKVTTIHIEARKSVVSLRITGLNSFAYQFDLYNCEFNKPESMVPDFIKNEGDEINASYNTGRDFPLIEFDLDIGSLTIEQQ